MRHIRHHILSPGHIVNIDLHNTHIRQNRAQTRTDTRRKMAIIIVRRNIELIRLGQIPYLLRLGKPIPRHIDHKHIRRPRLEIRNKLAHIKQIFTRTNFSTRRILNLPNRIWLVHIDLQPQQIKLFQHLGNAHTRLGFEIKIQIQINIDIRTHSISKRTNKRLNMPENLSRNHAIRRPWFAAKTPKIHTGRIPRYHDIRLQRRISLFHNLPPQRGNIVHRAKRWRIEQIAIASTRSTAMRPINANLLARWTPKKLHNRNTERTRLNINKREFNTRNSLCRNTPRTLPRPPQHIPKTHLISARILADEQRRQIAHRPRNPIRTAAIATLPPAANPLIGIHPNKYPRAPTRIHNKCLNISNLHIISSSL